jgi:DNA-binding transcriptional MerR regulator
MCLSDALSRLRADGVKVSRPMLHYWITSGLISRPPQDGSGRFQFGEQHLSEIKQQASSNRRSRRRAPMAAAA